MPKNSKNNTLMKKIITYFLIIIFSMTFLNGYISLSFKLFFGNVFRMLKGLVDIYSITMHVDKVYQNVYDYTHSGTKKYHDLYETELGMLLDLTDKVKEGKMGEDYYVLIDLQNMIHTYDERSREIFKDYEMKMQQVYIDSSVAELRKLKGDINDEAKEILLKRLSPIIDYYEDYSNEIVKQERLVYIMTGILSLACIYFAFRFSKGISNPIHKLAIKLQKVAKGDFDTGRIDIKTEDEINVLIESFNYMIVKIKDQIEEIKVKADIEKELKEQQIKNLEMRNLLNQSELLFLQSQINPHFLYNTMNSISALATIENAERTKAMIDCVSDMLKYNVKKINENVTIKEEYKIIEDYLHIQKERFGNRISFKLSYDEEVMDYLMPSMVLQPFVENAIIHGLEPKENDGILEVSIKDDNDNILILIKDNGIGMENETLLGLSNYDESSQNTLRGTGVANVVRRLEIEYGRKIVDINSISGQGTEVMIRLPKQIETPNILEG